MNIIYMGAGFVGACSAAVSADSGHHVLAFDINKQKVAQLSSGDIQQIRSCLHEEGLAELIIQHRDRLEFSSDQERLAAALEKADAIFMCLPTPESESGESDLTAFRKAADMLGDMMKARNGGTQSQYILIINKSTVPIRTIELTRQLLEPKGVTNFGIASNPEFLVEGQAIHDSIHPKRVVVGAENERDFAILRDIYRRFYDASTVAYLEMNPYEAATVKLLSNTALLSRLAYTFAVVGRICEIFPKLGYEQIKDGITSDPRIGKWGFYDSLYAGGSCLIKDALSLSHQMGEMDAETSLIKMLLSVNDYQLQHFVERAESEAEYSYQDKTVAVLGLSFKQGTNDIRHSGALGVMRLLVEKGVSRIQAHDPAANEDCRRELDAAANPAYKCIEYCDTIDDALQGSSCVFICTDWPEFRTLAENILSVCRPPYLVMDGRRIISHRYQALKEYGFSVLAVGSPLIGAPVKGAKK